MGAFSVLLVAVCLGLVGVLADPVRRPQPCCMADKFEMDVFNNVGYYDKKSKTPGQVLEMIRYHYDKTAQKIAMDIVIINTPVTLKIIQDFARRRVYTIMNGRCTYKPLRTPFTKACVPADATYLSTAYFGGNNNKLQFDNWHSVLDVEGSPYQFTMGVSQGDCIFISELIMGESKGVSSSSTVGMTGYTEGIRDPSVFTVPSGCTPGEPEVDRMNIPLWGISTSDDTKRQKEKLVGDNEFNDVFQKL